MRGIWVGSMFAWAMQTLAQDRQWRAVEVQIGGVPAGVKRVLLEHYRIDETHSNAYTAWKAMGSPARPTAEQEVKLKAAGQPEMMGSPEWMDVTAAEARVRTEMPRQATSLLRIRW